MSTAAAATAAAQAPPARRRRKLVVVGLAVLTLCLALGTAFVLVVQRHWQATQLAQDEEDADANAHANTENTAPARVDLNNVPLYVSLEPFTVNLADRDTERMAQVGITLEISNIKVADQIKDYMPAVRNHVLMAIADRNAAELLGRDGKARLAKKIIYEVSRTLGYEAPNPDAPSRDLASQGDTRSPLGKAEKPAAAATAEALGNSPAQPTSGPEAQSQKQLKPRSGAPNSRTPANPIRAVHFSAFIVQ